MWVKTLTKTFHSSLINDSFLCGIFPSKLKLAQVTQFLRKALGKTKITVGQHQLYLFLVKFLKRLCLSAFMVILNLDRNILYPLQFGFRQKGSTNHALIQITESIRNSIDNNEFGWGIFIDLKKAFDTVNHSILLSKLNHYGVRSKAYDLFQSYLSNREQFVCINGHKSDSLSITWGVLKGSIFGPLLFLLCINDLPNISKLLSFHVFANIYSF